MKRVTLFTGHYGSGKTTLAANFAQALAKAGKPVTLYDLDIVNPYFRAKDHLPQIEQAGAKFVSSPFAGSNVDAPALPPEMYAAAEDKSRLAVIDVGGDDRGALALGRLTPLLIEENDFATLLVVNTFRPLTRTADEIAQVAREIESACGLPLTAIVNNSNLGNETTREDVLSSIPIMSQAARALSLPVYVCADADLQIPDSFPIDLQGGMKL